VEAIDPNVLTNFTLATSYSANGMPGNPNANVELNVQQNSPTNYHVRVVNDGAPIESWAVNDARYLLQESGIVQLPANIDSQLFAPAVFMHSTPLPGPGDSARRVGSFVVDGRAATLYRMDPQDAARMAASDDAFVDSMRDATGALDVWIDDELQVVLQISGAVAWTNGDGTPGGIRYTYLLSAIGTTPAVTAPV
jgi:hypothetical protein